MTDEVNFTNWVNQELFSFITTQYDNNNPFYDIYCSFDYDTVQDIFTDVNEGLIPRKPIIHLFENNPSNSPFYQDNGLGQVQKINFEYTIFCVIDDKIQADRDRKLVLNDLSSKIKYKFDNNKDQLSRFRNMAINYSRGMLNRDADNLYASSQTLSFEVFKKVANG